MKLRSTALLAGAALLVSCSPQPGNDNALTTPEPIPAPAPAPTAAPLTATPPPLPPATTAEAAPATPKTCTVPNVVGLVHQTAQDTMQAAGLFFLHEEDATGQGRLLVVDRNWTTTAQSISAGEVVDCATRIVLSAKKIGE
ncbi:serine/threonine kinase [Saccharothrix lopnurensis]|uniref:Serine/threonine kinase n=1 Tax=Saccharothrix lopnurensis TaxID=1670621 RepID=A0ABW1P646_9PSEU